MDIPQNMSVLQTHTNKTSHRLILSEKKRNSDDEETRTTIKKEEKCLADRENREIENFKI